MRCFCCPALIPIPVSTFYDMKTDRFYCHLCQLYIQEYIMILEDPKKEHKPEDPILEDGEVENLEEDFDYLDDYYDDYDDYYYDDDSLIDPEMEDQ